MLVLFHSRSIKNTSYDSGLYQEQRGLVGRHVRLALMRLDASLQTVLLTLRDRDIMIYLVSISAIIIRMVTACLTLSFSTYVYIRYEPNILL